MTQTLSEQKNLSVLGICSGLGAQLRGCGLGPKALLEAKTFKKLEEKYLLHEVAFLHPKTPTAQENIPLTETLPLIEELNRSIAKKTKQIIQENRFPVCIGGDHSQAIGTWQGIASGLQEPLGLLWMDAHLDAHVVETSPSKAWHGMPVASLLGYGTPSMAQLLDTSPALLPENLVYIGPRSFEKEELELIQSLNIRTYFMEEVHERGLKVVVEEALSYLKTTHIGVSLDLDLLDPLYAPGVGSPESEGACPTTLLESLDFIAKEPRLKAFELVEYNPEKDIEYKTQALIEKILDRLFI